MKSFMLSTRRALCVFAAVVLITGIAAMTAGADNAYSFLLPDASWRTYSFSEIEDMPLQVICYAKNEIYARNGRMFVSGELQGYFNQQYWYVPVYAPQQFTPDMLNMYETANVAMLDEREQSLGIYALDQAGFSYDPVYQYLAEHYGRLYSAYSIDPNSYIFNDSDTRYLDEAEISALSVQELCYARNEIYARHGRRFVSPELQNYFNQKSWYWGTVDPSAFSESVLNDCEAVNAAALLDMENARGGYVTDQAGYSYADVGCYSSSTANTATGSEYIFWDSSSRYITEAEAASLSLQQLCYARNEIYARRGYIFQSQELRDYFGSKSWYYGTIPSDSFSSSVFNEYETANVELLKRYEYSINPNGYQLY